MWIVGLWDLKWVLTRFGCTNILIDKSFSNSIGGDIIIWIVFSRSKNKKSMVDFEYLFALRLWKRVNEFHVYVSNQSEGTLNLASSLFVWIFLLWQAIHVSVHSAMSVYSSGHNQEVETNLRDISYAWVRQNVNCVKTACLMGSGT